jgi:Domain of unknown function (DUF4389)
VSTLEQFSSEGPPLVPDPSGPPSPVYPAQLEISYPQELNRWLPLIKWLLVIPHWFALFFVGIGAFFVLIYAFFAVLFTGRFPRGAFDYLVGTYRWSYRAVTYAYLMTDAYPPFTLADDPNYPVRLEMEYPEHIANWRPLVQWLLAIPYLIVAGILLYVAEIVAFIAIFVILFTAKLPQGMFNLILNPLRWQLRGNAYAGWVVKIYPPFSWDD